MEDRIREWAREAQSASESYGLRHTIDGRRVVLAGVIGRAYEAGVTDGRATREREYDDMRAQVLSLMEELHRMRSGVETLRDLCIEPVPDHNVSAAATAAAFRAMLDLVLSADPVDVPALVDALERATEGAW